MKYLNLVLGTILSWFDNEMFSLAFALVLAQLGFLGAEANADIPVSNVAFLAFCVGTMTTAVLLVGTGIVCHRPYNWRSLLASVLGAIIGVGFMWRCIVVYSCVI